MKKITYTLILLFISITIVNAQPCFIVTGTGKNIGDEIACGTEHFYIVSNDGEEVKMLGKYNLLNEYIYDYIELDDYEYTYSNEIYKNKTIRDRINETGILLTNDNGEWNSEEQKYIATTISGTGNLDDYYQVIVFDEDVETKQEAVNHSKTIEMLNKGYKIYSFLTETYLGDYSWRGKCFGVIFVKTKNIEYKTVFLDGTSRTEKDMYLTKEVSDMLEKGYIVDDFIYDNYKSTSTSPFYDIYAVTMRKDEGIEYKSVFLDSKVTTKQKLIESDLVRDYVKQGYGIHSEIYDHNNSGNPDYYLITFFKDENHKIDFIYFDEPITEEYGFSPQNEVVQKKREEGYEVYTSYYNYVSSHNYLVYAIQFIETEQPKIYQDEKAIGINGDVNGPNYPIYGVVYQDSGLSSLLWEDNYEGESYGGGYYQDFDISSHTYFENYLLTLQDMGYPITSVSTLSVKDLNDLTKAITGKELPLEEWYENRNIIEDEYGWSEHAVLGNIKELYDGKHEWIWSTAYWLKTVDPEYDIYDINTLGDLCLTDVCSSTPSRGFRPLVTISAKNIVYRIETKTDGNGEVKADYVEAQGGTVVKFTVTPKEGFVLGEVKVTDSNGNVIIFKDYTFTMPNANVTIEANFIPKNPNTTDIILTICATLLISGIILTYINYRKTKLR